MRLIRHTVGIEPLISRVPSILPYMGWDEDGNVVIHPATDSVDGSYGKIVPNLRVPCNVSLCVYEDRTEDPATNEYWFHTPEATLTPLQEFPRYTTDMALPYLRKGASFDYQEVEEPTVPEGEYLYADEVPSFVDGYSLMHIKVPYKDAYGNIIPDCGSDIPYKYYDKVTGYNYVERVCVVGGGECYPYNELMRIYYEYKDFVPADNSFRTFVERFIGKIEVDKKYLGLSDEHKYPLVPTYVYLAEAADLYNKMLELKRKCDTYNSYYVPRGEEAKELCCECRKYEQSGGDRFLQYLKSLITKRDVLSQEYSCVVDNGVCGFPLLHFNVPLFHTHEDIGYTPTYLNYFEPSQRYYHGEYVIYNDRTYVVVLNRYVAGAPNNYDYVKCHNQYFMLSNGAYTQILVADISDIIPLNILYNGHQFIHYDGAYYRFSPGRGYQRIEMTEYTTGIWDTATERMVFDDTHIIPITQYYESLNSENMWYDQDNPYGTRFRTFVDQQSVPLTHTYDSVRVGGAFYTWNDNAGMYILDTDNARYYTVSGQASSQLQGLRRPRDFMNISDVVERPGDGEDWLYYYRRGYVSVSNSVSRDSYGNIQRQTNNAIAIGQTVTDLYAYGNVLVDIQYDITDMSLTFTYVIGAHLNAVLVQVDVSSDGTNIYRYDNFTYDSNDYHGVRYTETYYFDTDSDIYALIDSGEFDNYVSGNHDNNADYMFVQYPFSTATATVASTYTGSNGIPTEYSYIRSEYTETIPNELEYLYQPTYMREYLLGYSFAPDVRSSVAIDRGNSAAWERHLRLGEVNTFEDLENHSQLHMEEA